jgi:CBS domain-containing protein
MLADATANGYGRTARRVGDQTPLRRASAAERPPLQRAPPLQPASYGPPFPLHMARIGRVPRAYGPSVARGTRRDPVRAVEGSGMREGHEMNVGSIYRPEVFTIGTEESLAEAASSMQYNEVSALPVYEGDRLAGIVTERDVVRAVADGVDPQRTDVAEYMTQDPAWISPESSVGEAAERMLELGVRHFPVMIGDEVLGMISIRDLLVEVRP